MNKETLRMQMLAGVITEGEYVAIVNKEIEEADKASLNESMIGGIVGIGAINQIPPRAKTDYEMAFEHFLGERYQVKPNRERDDIKDVNEAEGNEMVDFVKQNFDTIKTNFLKSETDIIKDTTEDEEDEKSLLDYLNDSLSKATDVSSLIDVINERSIGVDLSDPEQAEELFDEIKTYASLEEGKEVEEPTNY
jgi:hypothetical protein